MYPRIPLSFQVKKVRSLLIYTLLGMLVTVSGYFFIKMSNTAERGYMLRENQLLQKDLETENKLLKQRVLDAQSITGLKSSETVLEMTEPQNTIFVAPKGPLTRRNR